MSPASQATADARPSAVVPAARSAAAWITLILIAAVALTLDLTGKSWSFANVANRPVVIDRHLALTDLDYDPIPPHQGVHVLPWSLLDLRLVVNRGAVFGTGQGRRVFLVGFTIIALLGAMYIFAFRTSHRQRLAHVSIALIIAGGAGNLFDRVRFGLVRDFLHMLPGWRLPFGWRYPAFLGGGDEVFPWVFNFADVMLLTGMGLLLLHVHRVERHRAALAQTSPVNENSHPAGDPAESDAPAATDSAHDPAQRPSTR